MSKENKFKELVNYFIAVYNNTNDEMLKTEAKESVKEFINYLAKLNPSKKEEYIEKLEQVGLSEKDLIISTEAKEEVKEEVKLTEEQERAIDYVNEHIYSSNNSNMINEFNELLEQLDKDFESPNNTLIETWVKNYKSFVLENDLDKYMMYYFMENLFVNKYKYDMNNIVEIYQEEIELSKDDKKVENESKPEVEHIAESNTGETEEIEEEKKEEIITTPEVENGTENNTSETEKIEEEKTVESVLTPEVEKLKIVSLEKPVKSDIEQIGTSTMGIAFALAVLGILPATALSFNFFGLAAYGVYRYAKSKKYKHLDLKSLLKKYDLDVEFKKEITEDTFGKPVEKEIYYLIDKKTKQKMAICDDKICMVDNFGKLIEMTEEQKSKIQYDELKNSLIKIGAMKKDNNSRFSLDYIKNNMLKNMVSRVKGYFEKRVERLNKRDNANSLDEKEKYAKSRISYDKDRGIYVFKDKDGNIIDKNLEEIEEKKGGPSR